MRWSCDEKKPSHFFGAARLNGAGDMGRTWYWEIGRLAGLIWICRTQGYGLLIVKVRFRMFLIYRVCLMRMKMVVVEMGFM